MGEGRGERGEGRQGRRTNKKKSKRNEPTAGEVLLTVISTEPSELGLLATE